MRISVPVQVTIAVGSEETVAAGRQAFERAWQRGLVQDVIRQIMLRTALREYRQMVLANLDELLEPQRADGVLGDPIGFSAKEQVQLLKLMERRDDAQRTGNTNELQRVTTSMATMQKVLSDRLARRGDRSMATGLFRERLQQVLDILTDPEQVALWRDEDGTIHWGVGRLTQLQVPGLRIPSYATYRREQRKKQGKVAGKRYTYPKALMWKQIEYGAGAVKGGRGPWSFGPLAFTRVKGTRGFPKLLATMQSDAVKGLVTRAIVEVVRNGGQ